MNITGTAHEDTAAVGVTAPHPFFFNASDTDASLTEHVLLRQEGAFNVQMMLAPIRGLIVCACGFLAGLPLFRYRADMVQDVDNPQLASFFSRANLVTITGYESEKAEGSGVGFHVGSDLSWFFSRVVGVGGFARFSHGTVTVYLRTDVTNSAGRHGRWGPDRWRSAPAVLIGDGVVMSPVSRVAWRLVRHATRVSRNVSVARRHDGFAMRPEVADTNVGQLNGADDIRK